MIKNIYLVVNHHLLYDFLALIKLGDSNLIITFEESIINDFIEEVLPTERCISISQIQKQTFSQINSSRIYKYFLFPMCIMRNRIICHNLLKSISLSSSPNVFFFSRSNLEYSMLIKYLQYKGAKPNYFNSVRLESFIRKYNNNEMSISLRLYLRFIELLSGLRLSINEHKSKNKLKIITFDYQNKKEKYNKISWNQIRQRIGWDYKLNTNNAVLLIDTPILSIKGIDFHETTKNLVKYFTHILQKDMVIHVKPRPKKMIDNITIHSLCNTILENKIMTVAHNIPAEMILDYYQDIYLYDNYTGSYKCNGTKYSLSKLLVFKCKVRFDVYWSNLKMSLGDEYANIKFVNIN